MKPKDSFDDFLIEFARLAEESDTPMSVRKEDLYTKLPYLLQNQVMRLVHNDRVSFKDFASECRECSLLIGQQVSSRSQGRTTSGGGKRESTTGSPATKREAGSSPTSTDRVALLKEGRCFTCRERGHLSRDCPKKTAVATVNTEQLIELEETTETGKA
ncbi:hypothetical protein N7510_001217 [Penicillium lagena]|uniref:uncharacterized protein n=1 Tax=Penicillium lagena TaxID=94218 RepID=UPI002541851A|nr:uncharacterized protein N7510_001217 [Penicillium lagena]KAJ5624908.1 hypothetical protein N7510_001217 [Penicillium lagena]